ncbi:hypothetical protein WN51_06507 [Melipona quadrifasciata]|uniref:Uncharacterized protein n=1 Tax=Melipona quadrifasciata TaxID=166423 RepID=A0A0N0BCJ4_9HYME|nr:hypothetical protein WN51_06507 [Melipona quadrifasciata]
MTHEPPVSQLSYLLPCVRRTSHQSILIHSPASSL